jgi:hypothetical protein
MIDIKDIFKFPVEKANVPNNVGNISEKQNTTYVKGSKEIMNMWCIS